MANHVTRRASGWTYQRRVPSRLVKHFGSKHVRMPLGRLSAAEARRVARRISVRLDLVWEFAEEEAVADDVEKIIQDMEQAIKNWEKYDEIFVDMIKGQATKLAEAETERAALQLTIRSIATAGEPPHPPALLFSAESARIIEAKRKALSARSTYPNKLRNAARAWILICGDHPVDRYRPAQLQDFANDLARLPRDWAVTERYRKLSYTEVVRIFDAETAKVVAAGKPPPLRFSQRNIAEYLAQVTHCLNMHGPMIRLASPTSRRPPGRFRKPPANLGSGARCRSRA